MEEKKARLVNPTKAPDSVTVKAWIGSKAYGFWHILTHMIAQQYPGIFVPEWIYGGKKHGWSLRYKKGKSFCTLIPEKESLKLLIVFGAQEREMIEQVRNTLSTFVIKQYDAATTYHDGKWLLLPIEREDILKDVEVLFAVKRKPKE